MASLSAGELFRLALMESSEEAREKLAEHLVEDIDHGLESIARRVGGEAKPDTVIAMTALEPVVAAVAYAWQEGKRVRVITSSEPLPGWRPLNKIITILEEKGFIEVYRMPLKASSKPTARDIVRRVARLAKGISARIVDVTDAPPYAVAGLYAGGVRSLTVLVHLGYVAVFQRFGFS